MLCWQGYVLHAQLVKAEDLHTQKYAILCNVRGRGLNEKTTVTLGSIESKELLCLMEDS